MLQKLTLALVCIVAIASATACGLMWTLAREFQAVAEKAQAANADLLAQGRDANAQLLKQSRDANAELHKQNQKMLEQLTTLANRPAQPAPSLEWNPLKIRVVKNDKKKTPAQGFTVDVSGYLVSAVEKSEVEMQTDENGLADFGLVRPGNFSATVRAPWGETRRFTVNVQPGKAYEKQILAPTGPLEPIQVQPIVKWKDLEELDVVLLVQVDRKDTTQTAKSTYWSGGEGSFYWLLIRPDGRFAAYFIVDQGRYGNKRFTDPATRSSRDQIYERIYFADPEGEFRESFPWAGRVASIFNLSVVQLPKQAAFPKEGQSLKLLTPSKYVWEHFSEYRTPHISRDPRQDDTKFMTAQSDGKERQKWTFEIPDSYIFQTKIMLAPAQFPKLPAETVVAAAVDFFEQDKDGNKELSKAEAFESNVTRFKEEDFPASFQKFIETYVERTLEYDKARKAARRRGS